MSPQKHIADGHRASRVRKCPKPKRQLSIFVRELELPAHVGVYDYEHGRTQPLIFDVEVALPYLEGGGIVSTFDYDRIVDLIREILSLGHHNLLESIADLICTKILSDERITGVNVMIRKPQALKLAQYAGISLAIDKM